MGEELKTTPATTLPEGWVWREWDDGSGSLQSPDGESSFSFDLQTSEYENPNTQETVFMPGYPEERMSRSDFRAFAEKWVNEHVIEARAAEAPALKPFNREEALSLLESGNKDALLGYDLKGADLGGMDLSGVDFSGRDLTGANLTGATLEGASFKGANLKGATLERANLFGADLSQANFDGATLVSVDLTGATLDDATFKMANLYGANLTVTKLNRTGFEEANLAEASFNGADLASANLKGAKNLNLIYNQSAEPMQSAEVKTLLNNPDVQKLLTLLGQPQNVANLAKQLDNVESQLAQALNRLTDLSEQLGSIPRAEDRQTYQKFATQTMRAINSAKGGFNAAKASFMANTRKALEFAQEKGAAGLEKVLDFTGVKSALLTTLERINNAVQLDQQNIDKIDSLGKEYHAIGHHAKRLLSALTGKEAPDKAKENGKLNELLKFPYEATKRTLEKAGNNVAKCLFAIARIELTAQRGRDKAVAKQLETLNSAPKTQVRESRDAGLER